MSRKYKDMQEVNNWKQWTRKMLMIDDLLLYALIS